MRSCAIEGQDERRLVRLQYHLSGSLAAFFAFLSGGTVRLCIFLALQSREKTISKSSPFPECELDGLKPDRSHLRREILRSIKHIVSCFLD